MAMAQGTNHHICCVVINKLIMFNIFHTSDIINVFFIFIFFSGEISVLERNPR
jgi:hypothetical protein